MQRGDAMREAVIRLLCEPQKDGTILVSSPEVPLFNVIIDDGDGLVSIAIPILKETLERNLKCEVVLRPIDVLDDFEDETGHLPSVPAHVIAQMPA